MYAKFLDITLCPAFSIIGPFCLGWSIQHAKDQPTMALVEPADMSSIVKAMDDGKGWAHDDENGNFEVLSSRSHLLSLMRSSI